MKKETINVFDGGLNKDLNPIVTPNNVLTDNLNGTFLTYNGDELSLQNDAGNTRIPVPDTGDSVKLSDGFYPLGIKEYGGVLYIVSGKKGINSSLDEIEFGSYPSPEFASYTTFKGEKLIPLKNDFNTLYKSFVINTDDFKTGRYIKFIPNAMPLPSFNNVWTRWNYQGLYDIRLLLKLNNGSIDLTEDIWNKFEAYKNANPEDLSVHWLLSQNFIYHCPYSYKGKLIIKTILSEPIFTPIKYYDVDLTSTSYNFQLDLKIENTGALEITGYTIEILADKVPFIGDTVDNIVTNVKTYSLSPEEISNQVIHISENIDLDNKLMHYTIIPIFKHVSSGTTLTWDSFPFEFQDKYKIKNYVLLEEKYNNIGFNLEENECIPGDGQRRTIVLTLIGENGYINPSLENLAVNEKPYAFYWTEGSPANTYNKLGNYTINELGLAVVSEPSVVENLFPDDTIKTLILSKLNQVVVKAKDASCAEGTITLRFSAPLEMASSNMIKYGKLSLYQPTSSNLLEYSSWDGKNFTVRVNLTESLNITLETPSFNNVSHTLTASSLAQDGIYDIALVTGFYFYKYTTYTGSVDGGRETKIFHNLAFYSKQVTPDFFELGDHIHEQFNTSNPNRLYVNKQNPNDVYTITDQRIFFSKNGDSATFLINISDDGYNDSLLRHYYYTIANATKVVPNEYVNIKENLTQSTDYIKIGSEQLGYIIFKESDVLHNLSNLINAPLYSNLAK